MILPSLLEYSASDLNKRLDQINKLVNEGQFFEQVYLIDDINEKILPKDPAENMPLCLHLDFVLSQFAKDRSPILSSLGPNEIMNCLKLKFPKTALDLSIHLMGELEDLPAAWQYFDSLRKPKNWKMTLYLPYNQASGWRRSFKKYKIGAWLDLTQWYQQEAHDSKTDSNLGNSKNSTTKIFDLKYIKSLLVMTVVAGKSGQKLSPEIETALGKILVQNPQIEHFIVDGGWDKSKATNFMTKNKPSAKVDFVAYSGFWRNIPEID